MSPEDQMQRIIDDPCASYWLKDAIRALLARDCLDAARDAAVLASLFERRSQSILARR